jgi:hypothetical protein
LFLVFSFLTKSRRKSGKESFMTIFKKTFVSVVHSGFTSEPVLSTFVIRFDDEKQTIKLFPCNSPPPTQSVLKEALDMFLTVDSSCSLLDYIDMAGEFCQKQRKHPCSVDQSWGQSGARYSLLRVATDDPNRPNGWTAARFNHSMFGRVTASPVWVGDWYLLGKEGGLFSDFHSSQSRYWVDCPADHLIADEFGSTEG